MSLTKHEYRELLGAALPVTLDADSSDIKASELFTPAGHRLSLDPNVTIVRGGRGVGKSVWFKALQDPDLRQIATDEYRLPQLQKVEPHAGWGAKLSPSYPSAYTLRILQDEGFDLVDIWHAVVLHSLDVPEITEHASWRSRVEWVRTEPESWERSVANADEQAETDGKTHLILFDAVEHLNAQRQRADELATALLRVALELRIMTRNLRAKIFIRHDTINNLPLRFSDASKLISNAAELTWDRTNLYGLLFHRLGNADSPHAQTFVENTQDPAERSGTWTLTAGRNTPPNALLGDERTQQKVFVAIAGQYMGQNYRKGHTYTWLPSHLADGAGQVSPRSFLEALRRANERSSAKYAEHYAALHWDTIKQGVQAASDTRAREITEDIDWVPIAFKPLKGQQVPISHTDVAELWRKADLAAMLEAHQQEQEQQEQRSNVSTGPRNYSSDRLIEELIELGVMTRRKNNMLDVPDIYRIHFDLGRKGGVPRVQSR